MTTVLSSNGIEFTAAHFCGNSAYHVKSNTSMVDVLAKEIPGNIWDMTPAELNQVCRNVTHAMNVLWSSSAGVPCFPEDPSTSTRYQYVMENSLVISGKGWIVTIYRNSAETAKANIREFTARLLEQYDKDPEFTYTPLPLVAVY